MSHPCMGQNDDDDDRSPSYDRTNRILLNKQSSAKLRLEGSLNDQLILSRVLILH